MKIRWWIDVLDKGSIELMNYTPDGDLLVVNAARCSFDKEHENFDYVKDTKLIKYLAKNGHVLPFRHPSATLRICAPIFVLRQLGKHQVGFSWSEVSRRYIKSPPSFYTPAKWRKNAEDIKQGSSDKFLDEAESHFTNESMKVAYTNAQGAYHTMIEDGVCPEQARMVLPQSMYTTAVTTGTLLGWHHLYKLRTEGHTQKETQEYAEAIGKVMVNLFPISWEALNENTTSN